MFNAPHHHQVLHAASQAAVANHPAWLDALLPWAQTPFFLAFAPCFVVLALLAIRHRVRLHRRGERFTKSKTKPAEMLGGALIMVALIYFRDKYPIIPLVFEWPQRTFPYYREHMFEMWVGFIAAVLAARIVSALYAAFFLRGGGGGGSRGGNGVAIGMAVGRHTLLQDPPDGFSWFSSPHTTRRVTRQRTYHIDEGE